MKPSQVKKSLDLLTQLGRPVFLWGPPGIGKTDIVNELAADRNIPVIDFRLAMRDPTCLMGFPMPDNKTKRMVFLRDGELPTDGEGILFLDEMNSAAPATQAAAMQLTLTRKIGEYTLPPGWQIIAAGNRESDRSVVHRMPSALSLRLVHIDYEIDLDDWCRWAIGKGISSDLIGFLRFRPDLLHKFDPANRSSPNPRSWVFVDSLAKSGLDADTEYEMIKGIVSEGPASEYVAFIKLARELPTTEQILLDPEGTKMPTAPGTLYALTTSLAMRAEKNNMDRLMKFVDRMQKEFQVVFVRDAIKRDEKIVDTKSFNKWAIANTDVLV